VAEAVLAPLAFRPGQRIVSLVATFQTARLRPLVAPAQHIVRAAPTPAAARRMGAILLCPPDPEVAGLLDGLGRLVQLDDEGDLDICWAVTGFMAPYFGLLEAVRQWLVRQGQDPAAATAYVAATFNAMGAAAEAEAKDGFAQLIHDHTTPGGLNEQALRELRACGWTDRIADALDLIHARIEGRATLADTLQRTDGP
jgi:pyrroline-5-carboxylate reductase